MPHGKIRVLIVDDSAAMRQLLTAILSSDAAIEVVGTASDPIFARDKILKLQPDVLTLDIDMPRMDGLTFLDKLMAGRPMPVVMVSSLTQRGADTTLRALELGAVDFFPKPVCDAISGIANAGAEIVEKVKAASIAKVARRTLPPYREQKPPALRPPAGETSGPSQRLIAIGASTGGTEAIRAVLAAFPADAPGTVVVQHMPPGFTATFAARLDNQCAIRVKEADDGDRVEMGLVLIAPGDRHMSLIRAGAEYRVRVTGGPQVNRHRPSVDVLFASCARHAAQVTTAAILTGMGDDGARGLAQLRAAGARTVAQDEATCVVFGMPKAAILRGAVDYVLPLQEIARKVYTLATSGERSQPSRP